MTTATMSSTVNQANLAQHRSRFIKETKYGDQLINLLDKSEVGQWRFERDFDEGSPRWWIHLTLPEHLQEMYDLKLEILTVYVEYPRVEPRLLSTLQNRMRSYRVEPGLAFIASCDGTVASLAQSRRGELTLIDINLAELGNDRRDIRARLAAVLATVDHYDMTNPIQDPGSFFGRKREIDQLTQDLNRGQSVGIFGLRKAGKTSLLNSLQKRRTDAGRSVVKLDLSAIDSAERFKAALLEQTWSVVRSTVSSKMPRLRLISAEGRVKIEAIPHLDLLWLDDLATLMEVTPGRIEVFIDEVDQAYPERSQWGQSADGLFKTLVQIRGLVQAAPESERGIVLLCAGVDPSMFEKPLITGADNLVDNLIYKLVRLQWLAPMERDEMREMIGALGKRMGVRIKDNLATDYLFEQYGGHPLLTRKACSVAANSRKPEELPFRLTQDNLKASSGDASLRRLAEDVFESFREWFPDEATVLEYLWSGNGEDRALGQEMLGELPNGLEHAKAYGLTHDDYLPRIVALTMALEGN